jgi:type I restriction-modification system DNA methylase subunit
MRNDAGINGDAQRIEQMAWMLFLKVYDEKENDWELDDDDYKSIIPFLSVCLLSLRLEVYKENLIILNLWCFQ